MEHTQTLLPTRYGDFYAHHFKFGPQDAVCLVRGDITQGSPITRIHSACLFSEALGAINCDCAAQLEAAMSLISREGVGIIVYLFQEGRGQGLALKTKASEVMRIEGIDTAEAYSRLNLEHDIRDYTVAIKILHALNASQTIQLATNNPRKISALESAGFKINTVALSYSINQLTKEYLSSKEQKLGHRIDWSKLAIKP